MPMPSPHDLGVIDLMLGVPDPGQKERWYDFLKPNLRDEESKGMAFPAQYMFKEVPDDPTEGDVIAFTLDQMDAVGIDKALIGFKREDTIQYEAIRSHPDRFLASISVDPNEGMKAIQQIVKAHGGRIWAENRNGFINEDGEFSSDGARFIVRLPST